MYQKSICKPQNGNQDYSPFINGVCFMVIITEMREAHACEYIQNFWKKERAPHSHHGIHRCLWLSPGRLVNVLKLADFFAIQRRVMIQLPGI